MPQARKRATAENGHKDREAEWHRGVVERVRHVLDEADLPQAQFCRDMADLLGVTEGAVKMYFKSGSNRKFTAYGLHRAAEYLGIDVAYFMMEGVDLDPAIIPYGKLDILLTKKRNRELQAAFDKLKKSATK